MGGGDDLQQVVDAVGAQQQLAHPVMEFLSGGSQELRLLRGREREPGQLTAGGEVTGADDGRNRYLSVDVAQECPITSGRPVLTRGLSGRQTDERRGQARSFQTPYEVVDDAAQWALRWWHSSRTMVATPAVTSASRRARAPGPRIESMASSSSSST